MPRVVRNFWLTADIDGRTSKFTGGPAAKDGGMDLTLKVRDHGAVVHALEILCREDGDGKLRVTVRPGSTLHASKHEYDDGFTLFTER
jgi:hypothetical protein